MIFIPLTRVMIKRDEPFDMPPLITERSEQDRSYGQGAVLKSAFFYLSMPQTIAAPFLLTGILFFQKELGNEFGWKLGWMAAYFSLFAVSRMVAQFLVGPLIDRVGAKRVFPFISLPLCLGLFLISFVPGPSVTILFLLFCGMSVGMGGPTKGALLAEVFGVNHLGAVKSLYGMLVVLSTSASPVIFGWLIDHGITLNSIVYASGIFLLGSTLLASLAPLPKERVTY